MGLLDSLRTRVGYYLDPPLTEPAPRPSTPHNPQLGTLFDPKFKIGQPVNTSIPGAGGVTLVNDPNIFGPGSVRCQVQTVAGAQALVSNNGTNPTDVNDNSCIVVPAFYALTVDIINNNALLIVTYAQVNLTWLLAGQEPLVGDGPLTQS
jgi:hypothetical protein